MQVANIIVDVLGEEARPLSARIKGMTLELAAWFSPEKKLISHANLTGDLADLTRSRHWSQSVLVWLN